MEHPKVIGDRTTMAVMLALIDSGYGIYVPFGENTRCDLLLETDATLKRVQCKTGRLRNGAVRFATCSTYAHHPNPKIRRRSYVGEIDYFAVFCRETNGVYLVPIDELPARTAAALRIDPPLNNQHKRVRWASRYEIARVEATPVRRARPGAAGSCA